MKRMTLQENNRRSLEILGAYGRMGLRELGNALDHSGSATTHPEYGTLATKPPSMVVEGLRGRESLYGAARNDVPEVTPEEGPTPEPEIAPEPQVEPQPEIMPEPEVEPDLDLDMD